MVDLDQLIVCSVCRSDLSLESMRRQGAESCPNCATRYSFNGATYNMTPSPPPDGVRSKWDAWQKLQTNGLLCYTKAPELNLSVGRRTDALEFREFCNMTGLILDVGCGPQQHPSYLPDDGQVVGLDPLTGHQPRGFAFVQGIGEYLPFRGGTFDHIVFAWSLDHMIRPRLSLAEAARCLKSGGAISMWLDAQAPAYSAVDHRPWGQYVRLVKKGIRTLSRHGWINKMGFKSTVSYVGMVARMEVPAGAVDCFHFEHLTLGAVSDWLDELGLRITRQAERSEGDNLFLQAQKRAADTL